MHTSILNKGIALLGEPVLPLVSMVEFFLLTGDFKAASEIIDQLPEPIETGSVTYVHPREALAPYGENLTRWSAYLAGQELPCRVTDVDGNTLDHHAAAGLLIRQEILTAELERINSELCAPCLCTLCCVGPEERMQQEFFEIPLQGTEIELFAVERIDSAASRACTAMDEPCLETAGMPFYQRHDPAIIHWKNGWSMVLPKKIGCPQLEPGTGRCLVYPDRPRVCRRPQIFPYILEPVAGNDGTLTAYRQRSTILAVMDCPYVQVLQEEIAAYAAACELDILFTHNKG